MLNRLKHKQLRLGLLLALALGILLPATALAAPKKCFFVNTEGAVTTISCSQLATGANSSFTFEDGKCYIADGPGPEWPNTRATDCSNPGGATVTNPNPTGSKYYCGSGSHLVYVSIDLGCTHKTQSPVTDVAFAVIRLLSDGVGLIIIGSIIVGGIQYSASRGDPQATAMAVNRLRSTVIALFIFIFGYAILNYIIPAGFIHG